MPQMGPFADLSPSGSGRRGDENAPCTLQGPQCSWEWITVGFGMALCLRAAGRVSWLFLPIWPAMQWNCFKSSCALATYI